MKPSRRNLANAAARQAARLGGPPSVSKYARKSRVAEAAAAHAEQAERRARLAELARRS
jgi:hypothetical protein